jgi:Transcription initiation factor IIA, gamma subunit, helical domain
MGLNPYRSTKLGEFLEETLEELVDEGKLTEELAGEIQAQVCVSLFTLQLNK